MRITKVTITGADENVSHSTLEAFSAVYPFVEWGVLLSKKGGDGMPRYPGFDWVDKLDQLLLSRPEMNCSAHLCGEYSRRLITGERITLPHISNFKRVQVNANFIATPPINDVWIDEDTIIQYNENNKDWIQKNLKREPQLLFDASGGNGISPSYWPLPIQGIKCGYAGGINPDNIKQVCETLSAMPSDSKIWIDMEAGVRTNDLFDLEKVHTILSIADLYINKEAQP